MPGAYTPCVLQSYIGPACETWDETATTGKTAGKTQTHRLTCTLCHKPYSQWIQTSATRPQQRLRVITASNLDQCCKKLNYTWQLPCLNKYNGVVLLQCHSLITQDAAFLFQMIVQSTATQQRKPKHLSIAGDDNEDWQQPADSLRRFRSAETPARSLRLKDRGELKSQKPCVLYEMCREAGTLFIRQ